MSALVFAGRHDVNERRERTVVELHLHSRQRTEGRGDFEQLEDDRSLWSEHRTGGNAKQEAVSDLTGGPGHCNTYW